MKIKSVMLVITLVAIVCTGIFSLMLYSGHPYSIIDNDKSDNYFYTVFKREVHYVPMGNWFALDDRNMESLNRSSFKILGQSHIADSTKVFYLYQRINGADPSSFQVIKEVFAKDNTNFYYRTHSFQDIDIASAHLVENDFYEVEDKTRKYTVQWGNYDQYAPPNQRIYPLPNGYQFLSKNYGKDNQQVYYKGIPITGAIPLSFNLLNDYYAQDSLSVYYDGKLLIGANTLSFSIIKDSIGRLLAKDNKKVYFGGLPVSNLDASSFEVIGNSYYTKDKNGVYHDFEEQFDEHPKISSYTALNVESADIDSFTPVNKEEKRDALDKGNSYWKGKVVL